uniref:Uncharacterized protein n=1 Tax=Chrysotila carterae TaxID=13221 RepID=A0A6S9TM95_CHRCT|eukprot:6207311-Pleurochrysis_carterae.AAC.4
MAAGRGAMLFCYWLMISQASALTMLHIQRSPAMSSTGARVNTAAAPKAAARHDAPQLDAALVAEAAALTTQAAGLGEMHYFEGLNTLPNDLWHMTLVSGLGLAGAYVTQGTEVMPPPPPGGRAPRSRRRRRPARRDDDDDFF